MLHIKMFRMCIFYFSTGAEKCFACDCKCAYSVSLCYTSNETVNMTETNESTSGIQTSAFKGERKTEWRLRGFSDLRVTVVSGATSPVMCVCVSVCSVCLLAK